MIDSQNGLDWAELAGRLGDADALDRGARVAGALLRKREIGSAVDLLRLCFAFVLGRFSLRMLAAWAEQSGLASLSDVAVLKRLKASADWIGGLVSELLVARYPECATGAAGGLRLLAVDATAVTKPGPARDYWLVHTVFDLSSSQLSTVEVTDRHSAERLTRGGVAAGELRLADRVHAKADELAAVVAAGSHFLVRAPSREPRLLDPRGERLERLSLCRAAQIAGVLDQAVTIEGGKSGVQVAARMVILPLPPAAAEKAKAAARRNANRWGYQASCDGVEMAGYLVLLTSLPAADWPAERLLATYRLRWQIELAFKRMKSLIGLEDLRAKDPDLARLWINTALLAALLIEDDLPDLEPEAPDSLPRAA